MPRTIGTVCGESLIYFERDSSATFKMEETGPHQVAAGPQGMDIIVC